ncbi:hypothetical protein ACFX11_037253 [Malus domestica]
MVLLRLTAHIFILFLSLHVCCCSTLDYLKDPVLSIKQKDSMLPMISPTATSQPFLPLLAPSPLAPYTNTTVPKLSGSALPPYSLQLN